MFSATLVIGLITLAITLGLMYLIARGRKRDLEEDD